MVVVRSSLPAKYDDHCVRSDWHKNWNADRTNKQTEIFTFWKGLVSSLVLLATTSWDMGNANLKAAGYPISGCVRCHRRIAYDRSSNKSQIVTESHRRMKSSQTNSNFASQTHVCSLLMPLCLTVCKRNRYQWKKTTFRNCSKKPFEQLLIDGCFEMNQSVCRHSGWLPNFKWIKHHQINYL